MNNRSPCLECEPRDQDKNKCASICDRLNAFQCCNDYEDIPIPTPEELGEDEAENPKDEVSTACTKCRKHPAVMAKEGSGVVNGLCGFRMSKPRNEVKERKNKMKQPCDVPGCQKKVKARGKCGPHYEQWRAGKLPGQPPFTRIEPHKGRKKQGKVVETLPESVVIIDLSGYPQLRDLIFATARRFMVTPAHIIISLAGEGAAARNNNKK